MLTTRCATSNGILCTKTCATKQALRFTKCHNSTTLSLDKICVALPTKFKQKFSYIKSWRITLSCRLYFDYKAFDKEHFKKLYVDKETFAISFLCITLPQSKVCGRCLPRGHWWVFSPSYCRSPRLCPRPPPLPHRRHLCQQQRASRWIYCSPLQAHRL